MNSIIKSFFFLIQKWTFNVNRYIDAQKIWENILWMKVIEANIKIYLCFVAICFFLIQKVCVTKWRLRERETWNGRLSDINIHYYPAHWKVRIKMLMIHTFCVSQKWTKKKWSFNNIVKHFFFLSSTTFSFQYSNSNRNNGYNNSKFSVWVGMCVCVYDQLDSVERNMCVWARNNMYVRDESKGIPFHSLPFRL